MNIVKALRLKAGMQQQELANLVGVSSPTVSDWEHQRKNPHGENLRRLAEIFGVDPLEVLGTRAVTQSDLTPDELELIKAFRQLNESGQTVALAAMNGILSQEVMRKEASIA